MHAIEVGTGGGGGSALYGGAVKIGASVALLLTGYILIICGFDARMPHEAMALPISNMRILFAVVPSIGLVISYFAMVRFMPERETVHGTAAE